MDDEDIVTPCCDQPMSSAEWAENVEAGDCSICGEVL